MAFSPNIFLANMKAKGGPAKTNRFQVILPIPLYVSSFIESSFFQKLLNFPTTFITDITQDITNITSDNKNYGSPEVTRYLALQCESAELPGKTLQTTDVKIYGPTFKVPYQTQYQEMTLNFICTNEFFERKLFERWMESIMPTDTNNMRFPKGVSASSGYYTEMKVIQYDDFVKQVFAVNLIDAFPIGMSSQQLSWSDDNFHRLSVQFAYQKYKPVYEGKYDPNEILGSLFGVIGSRIQNSAGSITNVLGGVTSRIPGLGGNF